MQVDEELKDFLNVTGFVYLRHNKWDKARVLFEALHVLFPQDLYYAKVLSFIYLQVEEYEKALEQAERLIRQTKD